jgi:hypothetical protein
MEQQSINRNAYYAHACYQPCHKIVLEFFEPQQTAK